MPRLLVVLLFLSAARFSYAETPPSDDQLKAHLWYTTATYIWEVKPTKAPTPIPRQWRTVKEFKKWFQEAPGKDDKSGLATLKNAVFKEAKGDYSPQQLADTLVSKVQHDRNELGAVKFSELRQRLNDQLPLPSKKLASSATLPAKVISLPASAGPIKDTLNNEVIEVTTSQLQTENPGNSSQLKYFWLWLAISFVLGIVVANIIKEWLRYLERQKNTLPVSELVPPKSAAESNQELKQQLGIVKDQNKELQNKNEELKKQVVALLAKAEQLESHTADSETPNLAAIESPTASPIIFYTSEVEGGYLPDNDLKTDAAPYYALRIQINPKNTSQATFDLNPAANQQTLLAYRLPVLREYFDMNVFVGKPNALRSTKTGQLVREGDGWRVTPSNKGHLDVR